MNNQQVVVRQGVWNWLEKHLSGKRSDADAKECNTLLEAGL
jgi:hypothetical protein